MQPSITFCVPVTFVDFAISKFFSHLKNGKDLMVLFLYGNNSFKLFDFAEFIESRSEFFKHHERSTQFGMIPNIDRKMLLNFFDDVYYFFDVEKFPDPIAGSPQGVIGLLDSIIGGFSPILYTERISSVAVFLATLNHCLHPKE